jgi:hypothetical protein
VTPKADKMARRKTKKGRRDVLRLAKSTLAFPKKAATFVTLKDSGISPRKIFTTLKRRAEPRWETGQKTKKQTIKPKVKRDVSLLHYSKTNLQKDCRNRRIRTEVLFARKKTGTKTNRNIKYKERSKVVCK